MTKGARLLALILFFASIALPQAVFAWHGPGHMATAVVAFKDLGPANAHKVADILRHHEDYDLWMKDKPAGMDEDEYLFMKASTWPDDIRPKDAALGDNQYSHPTWHYIDTPYIIGNQPLPKPDTDVHAVDAEAKNIDIVEHSSDQAERARALCWIFHLVGDIHMPLHATSMFSPQFPNGDAGGNREYIKTSTGRTTALHTFWDGLWDSDTDRPAPPTESVPVGFGGTDLTKIEPIADRVMTTYPRANLPELATATTFTDWMKESYTVCVNFVYLNGALPISTERDAGAPLPAGYETMAKTIGESRLALGGYRLADTLRSTLGL